MSRKALIRLVFFIAIGWLGWKFYRWSATTKNINTIKFNLEVVGEEIKSLDSLYKTEKKLGEIRQRNAELGLLRDKEIIDGQKDSLVISTKTISILKTKINNVERERDSLRAYINAIKPVKKYLPADDSN